MSAAGEAGSAVVQTIDAVRRPQTGRVPPHNLEAEESLLGAMLLSRDAITAAVEARVDVSDFYKPSHGHIYDAIQSLYGQGEPADPVTVAEELRRADLLEFVGGRPALLQIQASTPASANAGHYARIVNELALLRRLIAVAGDISEMGYDSPDDVVETLDRAEALVFEVAERRVSETMVGIHDALQETLDDLEARYGDASDLVGVPTGFTELDANLHGLQRENLVIVAARPGMGKTSLALGMARNVATSTGRPVIFFSMEMGTLELTKRLLAMEARVEATRLVDGSAHRRRLVAARPRGRPARGGQALHRRQPALHGHGDARQGAPHARPLRRPRPHRRRLHPAHDPEHVEAGREPPGRGVGDLPRPQDPRPRARVPGGRALAAQPAGRVPPRQAADARRPP